MSNSNIIRISVRNLIEFVMRSGDIDNSYRSYDRALEGIIAHNKVQKEYRDGYEKEVPFVDLTELEGISFLVSGRCDGLYEDEDYRMIDEIKSTTRLEDDLDPEYNQMHWAQAKVYGYFYMKKNDMKTIDVQLTYINLDEDYIKRHKNTYEFEELKAFYYDLLDKYLDFSRRLIEWKITRNSSIKNLDFPYRTYRKGQRKMAIGIYEAILQRKNIFIDAPTGIGKTMSAMFPSVKAIGEGKAEKIFYLSARTTTQKEAIKSINLIENAGSRVKFTVITAKEKACINDEKVKCNPKDCPYANGHFDRINDAIIDIYDNEDSFDKETMEEYSRKHKICPFEFALDMAIYSDLIICDYNYAFSPGVYLKRFFDDYEDPYIFLVDEAHNLVDRGKDMFSAGLSKKYVRETLDLIDEKFVDLRKKFLSLLGKLEDLEYDLREDEDFINKKATFRKEKNEEIDTVISPLMKSLDKFLGKEKNAEGYDEVLDFYFYLNEYQRIGEIYQEGFLTTFEKEEDDFLISLRCIDTSNIFKDILKRAKSSVLFSATLTPMEYYVELLGGDEDSLIMHLQSPFDEDNLLLLNASNISTRYRDRVYTKESVARYIHEFVSSREGNYLIYFPSYRYLDLVYEEYSKKFSENVLIQKRYMSNKDREDFLSEFKEDSKTVAFGVLGGIFAEGIDLVGEKLIGVCVVSVGMPGLSYERTLIQGYFDEKENKGFDYAFTYPGINKVLQGAGRVIRSEEDKGAVLLIDDRFSQNRYRKLYPRHWSNMKYIYTLDEMKELLDDFWRSI